MKKCFCVLLLIVGFWSGSALADAKTSLNQVVLNAYEQNIKNEAHSPKYPVIIANLGKMTLYFHDKTEQVNIIPEEYTELKIFSHIVMGVYATTHSLSDLEKFRDALLAIKTKTPMVDDALIVINDTIKNKKLNPILFKAYAQKIKPQLWENVNNAAKAQINLVNQVVMNWKKKMTKTEWQNLTVVVMGVHGARTNNLLMQYFSKVLNIPMYSEHLIYAECIKPESDQAGLNLYAHVKMDADLAEAVFQDRVRMERDVLGDVAATHLKKIPVIH